jgi:hypothetical protein
MMSDWREKQTRLSILHGNFTQNVLPLSRGIPPTSVKRPRGITETSPASRDETFMSPRPARPTAAAARESSEDLLEIFGPCQEPAAFA